MGPRMPGRLAALMLATAMCSDAEPRPARKGDPDPHFATKKRARKAVKQSRKRNRP